MTVRARRAAGAAITAVLAALLILVPSAAQAHSLDSTTVSIDLETATPTAKLTMPTTALAQALGVAAVEVDADAATAYVADHLAITSTDGTVWAESFHDAAFTTVEGIDSFTVVADLGTGGSDVSSFTLAYDGIVEAVPGHEAVVVLIDRTGAISTAGVIGEAGGTLAIGEVSSLPTGLIDMVGHGISHVLAGADHLLFLLVLLLPAALVVRAGRWEPGRTPRQTARQVLSVVTAFTVGHSITLVLSGLGVITVPAQPVEILIAVSVAVGALHAIRPLVRGGEQIIAGCFGLVHGLAFAAILTTMSFDGAATVGPLLAFNVGVEVAQLLVLALVLPSLHVIGRTRFERPARLLGAGIALLAAGSWILDRTGLIADPFAGIETAVVGNPWWTVLTIASAAAILWSADRRMRPIDVRRPLPDRGAAAAEEAATLAAER